MTYTYVSLDTMLPRILAREPSLTLVQCRAYLMALAYWKPGKTRNMIIIENLLGTTRGTTLEFIIRPMP